MRPGAGLDTTGLYSSRKPLGTTRRLKKPFLGGTPLVKAPCHPGLLTSGQTSVRPACTCPGHVRAYFRGAGVLIGAKAHVRRGWRSRCLGDTGDISSWGRCRLCEPQHLKGCRGTMIVPKSGRELQGDGYEFTCGRHFKQQEPSRDGETVS